MNAIAAGRPSTSAGSIAYAAQLLVLAAAYFAAAKLALSAGGTLATVWPASGIALACVLLFGYRVWPGVWLGAALAAITVASSPVEAALVAAGGTLEAVIGALLVRRCIGMPRSFERGEDVVEFVAIAALSAAVSATAATALLAWPGSTPVESFAWTWWTRWQADAMGIVIVAPLILNWSARSADGSRRKTLEMLCLAVPTLAATQAIFGNGLPASLPSLPLTFVILPFVIWAALRFAQREVATLDALICAIAVWHTLEGRGPFASAAHGSVPLLLLAFTSSVVITGLVLNAVVGERGRAIDALAQALKTLREEAIRDPLTNLYNRRFLRDYLSRELLRAKREGIRVAVIMIDLDHFKRVNDTAGHGAGDEVLVQVAGLLKRHIRGSDIACRFGGEEFTLVLPNATPQSALARAEAICQAVREESDRLMGVTASLGVSVFPDGAGDAAGLLRSADLALYQAKGRGRDQVRVFSRQPASVSTLRTRKPKRAA
ncbi:MAG TPA: diguanylate cyclase [Burkholderiales bacterium]|nr:diguanylate cyclase [Burkholderiales bacterium]